MVVDTGNAFWDAFLLQYRKWPLGENLLQGWATFPEARWLAGYVRARVANVSLRLFPFLIDDLFDWFIAWNLSCDGIIFAFLSPSDKCQIVAVRWKTRISTFLHDFDFLQCMECP